MRSLADSERSWLAFRYVSGDLTAVETEAFERRLDHDQAARAAVAEAVALFSVVAALPPDTLAALPVRRRAPLWLAAVAAGLLLAAGMHWLAPAREGKTRGGLKSNSTRAVALLWSGLHQENAGAPGGSDDLLTWLDESSVRAETEVVAASEPAEGVPSWLWEAATLSRAEGPSAPETQEN